MIVTGVDPASRWYVTDAYIAGFFDGEGSVQIRHRGPRWECALRIVNTSWPILRAIQDRTGGALGTRKGTHGTFYELCIQHRAAARWARRLRKHCRIKCDELDLLIEFQGTLRHGFYGRWRPVPPDVVAYRNDLIQTCRALKRRRFPA